MYGMLIISISILLLLLLVVVAMNLAAISQHLSWYYRQLGYLDKGVASD